MRRKMIVTMVLVLIMGLTGSAWAKSGNHGKSMNDRFCQMGAGPMCGLNRLDLTAQQWDKAAAILDKHKEEIRTLHQKMWEARKALHEAVLADTFNEQQIRAASKTLAANMEEAAVLRGKVFSEIRAILTPKQIEQMKKMRALHQAKMKTMREYNELMHDSMMPGPMMHHGSMMHDRMGHGGMMQQ